MKVIQEIIGYKALHDGRIAKLQILGENNECRSNIRCFKYQKYRCSGALVLDIWNYRTFVKYSNGVSLNNDSFEYNVDKIVEPQSPFETDLNEECASGIHYFKTLEAAIGYDPYEHYYMDNFSGKVCISNDYDCSEWNIYTVEDGRIITYDTEKYEGDKLIRKKSYINICDNIRDVEYRKTYERTYNKHGRLIKTIKYKRACKKRQIE